MRITQSACIIASICILGLSGCSGGSGPAKSLDQSSLDPQPGVIYYIDDHLGSSNLLTDSQGTVLHEESRYPFGIERGSAGEAASRDYAYTGKEYDAETDLVYFGGRYYSPTLARWITPDPLFLENPAITLKRPFEGNLYSYGGNNPIKYVDKDGNLIWDIIDIGCFAYSAQQYVSNPTFENGVNLALDTVSLLPVVPSLGAINRGVSTVASKVGKSDNALSIARKTATGAIENVPEGTRVTRHWGGDSGPFGRSWTRDPIHTQSRNSLGLETANSGNFVSHGRIIDNPDITVKSADSWGRFKGGGDELIIPNAKDKIRLDAVTMPDNPLPFKLPSDPIP